MAKTTILVLFILTVIAALLFGINIVKKIQSSLEKPPTPTITLKPSLKPIIPSVTSSATPSAASAGQTVYKNTACGYEIVYPKTWIKQDYDAKSIALSENQASNSAKIAIVCAQEIPKPPLTEDKIEQIKLSSVSATLYHDSSPKDGTPLDEVIATIPGKSMDIFIAGFGPTLQQILSTFRFLQ